MNKKVKEQTKTLVPTEIAELAQDIGSCFEYLASLKRDRPLSKHIQNIKIPSILSESIICDLIQRGEVLQDFKMTKAARAGGQKMPDIAATSATREFKIEVKGTGKSGFQTFGKKDLECDILVWLHFGHFFEVFKPEVQITAYIVHDPAKVFAGVKTDRIMHKVFMSVNPSRFSFYFSEKYPLTQGNASGVNRSEVLKVSKT